MHSPESIHPSLWRASQLARGMNRCIDSGHAALSAELPGGGWPVGSLIELLLQQNGIGELRLLQPALRNLGRRRIALLQPPYPPQTLALAELGLAPSQLLWIAPTRNADALWAAEQILRADSCGALLCWQNQVRNESLRRLHLAAQSGGALFFMLRPLHFAPDASPAILRLRVAAAAGGVQIGFAKRRGPQRDTPLFIPLPFMHSSLPSHHVSLDRPAPAPAAARSISPTLVE
ncbi:translesion DNA synthesis-associated protein ImuA [Oxalobacteraceae bacterium CAVE-383]|nr:translesion DNA synthesis-associated protein ImuA [Oxalobacteraceae bacterium CAVE-383]